MIHMTLLVNRLIAPTLPYDEHDLNNTVLDEAPHWVFLSPYNKHPVYTQ
ncbi:MAG: hypothetical protein JXR16_11745 [Bermanella sp.]